MPKTIRLVCIDAPHFCVGVVLQKDRVTCAAPVVKYMIGWSLDKVVEYCSKKGWHTGQTTMKPLMHGAWEIGGNTPCTTDTVPTGTHVLSGLSLQTRGSDTRVR